MPTLVRDAVPAKCTGLGDDNRKCGDHGLRIPGRFELLAARRRKARFGHAMQIKDLL
jgi:hypothetical protein